MPTPQAGESHEDFIDRCIPVVLDDGTARDGSQARAICESMWDNRNRSSHPAGGRKTMTKEHKAMRVKALDDNGRGTAIFATFGVKDLDGDVTEPGAFGKQDVLVLPTHDWSSVPLGKGVTREDGNEALVDFQLNLDTAAGRDWHSALKFDLNNGAPIQEWSYGFSITDAERKVVEGEEVRVLKALDVHEVSPVVLGAGVGTRTLAVKAAIEGGELPADKLTDLIETIHKHVGDRTSRRFADQIADTLKLADDVIERAESIRAARAEDRKDVSADRIAEIKALAEKIETLETLAKQFQAFTTTGDGNMTDENTQAGDRLYAKVLADEARRAGVKLCPSGFCRVDGKNIKGETLGRLITELREEQDMSQADLASEVGLDASTVSDIEVGEVNCPPLDRLDRLASALGTSASRLRSAAESDGCEYSDE